MENFLSFLESHYIGLLLICVLVFTITLLINWLAWIFSWGRFKGALAKDNPQGGIFYLFADLIVKIINDFRHFLALVLVFIFAGSLAYAIIAGGIENLSGSVQAIMSTLGTLVGSIVGYYFGESAVKKATRDKDELKEIARPVIQPEEPIKEIIPPESIKD